jgi:hypothetical protein
VFGKHILSLKAGLIEPEAQAQPGLDELTDNQKVASSFFLKKSWTQSSHMG